MNTQQIIRLLIRTLHLRGVFNWISEKVAGYDTSTPEGREKAKRMRNNSRYGMRAIRLLRNVMRF